MKTFHRLSHPILRHLCTSIVAVCLPLQAQQEVGFIETFALAENRAEALKQLIPGTEDYYYYHALHYQNERQKKAYQELIADWKKRFPNSSGRKQIENREALIAYQDQPKESLDYLKKELGLNFNHQQEGKAQEAKHPSSINQNEISWETYLKEARSQSGTLENIEPSIFYRFLSQNLEVTPLERRSLLGRAILPDLPKIENLILADLNSKESRGFGEFQIHHNLTISQLEKLLSEKPDLLQNEKYVEVYLAKLLPNSDENLLTSPQVRESYLDRAWTFASTLSPKFNSLKAHLLFHRLVHDQQLGRFDQKRFMDYLALPRNASYLNPQWRTQQSEIWRHPADLERDYQNITTFPPVAANDEPLIKTYLLRFLKDTPDSKAYALYLNENWLRRVFAEAKITNAVGKPSDWASLLSPSEFQTLKERVDIEFDSTSKRFYSVNEDVILPVHLKNVPKLIIKVFEINTLNYYRNLGQEISTDIDLDGLVANHVETHEYESAPQLRSLYQFQFPFIKKQRGLWVIEFIGGGKSSRAIIRKGSLDFIKKTIHSGELVTVIDEAKEPLKNASIWLEGRQYSCNQQGQALLPFSNNPGQRDLIIQDESGFSTMGRIIQSQEDYRLNAAMHLDQEALRSGAKASIIIRPTLSVAGKTISLTQIDSASLHLESINLDGIKTTTSISKLNLSDDRELTHNFRVPDRITQLTATLRAKIKVASQGAQEVELSDSRAFSVNEFLRNERIGDLYLSQINQAYQLDYLGRNGEPLSDQLLTITLRRKGFKNQRSLTLKTDQHGSLDLGTLKDIESIMAREASGHTRTYQIPKHHRDYPDSISLTEGQELTVPFGGELNRESVALFSQSLGGVINDEFSRLKANKNTLSAQNLPAGDYQLHLKESDQRLTIMVSRGTVSLNHCFNETRALELPRRLPSHLSRVTVTDKNLEIEISNADELTRLHLVATRFLPEATLFENLHGSQRNGLMTSQTRHLPCLYISGRNLGDELRYILERRYLQKYPGNMLSRPEILLNPWALRNTESGEERLSGGDKFQRKPVAAPAPAGAVPKQASNRFAEGQKSANQAPSFDFLINDPVLLANLIPNKEQKIIINLDAFGDRQHLHLLLVDPDGTTYENLSLKDRATQLQDIRLGQSLDPRRQFTEKDHVTLLKKGEKLNLPDLANTQFEIFDTLESAYRYLLSLNNDPILREFSFLTGWNQLTKEEKAKQYSQYSSHELNFFLSQKDPDYFKQIILPHLANKKDRTFLDDYLLGKPLDQYLETFEYSRLNTFEKILLSQKDSKRTQALILDLHHRLSLTPPDRGREQQLFGAALGGGGFGDTYAGKKRNAATAFANAAELPLADGIVSGRRSLGRGVDRASADAIADKESRLSRARKQSEALFELSKEMRDEKSARLGDDPFGASPETEKLALRLEQLYRSVGPTKEWAENNYYHLPISEHLAELIPVNQFWIDLAKHGLKPGFGSRHLGLATSNAHEMLLALAVLDLPFSAPKHQDEIKNGSLEFTAGDSVLFFHREIREADLAKNRPPILVSQNYFDRNNRFRVENGQKIDQFITEEFVRGLAYGSQIVVTNTTSSQQRLDLLTQLPQGSVPLLGQKITITKPILLEPYSTFRSELAFYFPESGAFSSYPAHLSKNGEVIAMANNQDFKVVDQPTKIDQSSWNWVSQWAQDSVVLEYLRQQNLHIIDLDKIAWRFRESKNFYQEALSILKNRGVYHPTLYSYCIAHGDRDGIAQFLHMQAQYLNQCGLALKSDLITIDPIARRAYQHLEYKPLMNHRAHQLGGENRILNPMIREQYQSLLTVLSQRSSLEAMDRLSLTYYLFLQDRVDEALTQLQKIDGKELRTQVQFDYFQAFGALYEADIKKARQIAKKYQSYPIDRWKILFSEILSQIREIEGDDPKIIEAGNRTQEQNAAADREPSLELKITPPSATLHHRNIGEVIVNYYEIDLEFLFSTNPFVSGSTSQFSIIRPNHSTTMKLPKNGEPLNFDLPKKYLTSNIIVEVIGEGKIVSQALYSNDLKTTLAESMGILSVKNSKTNKPLSKTYVKVYARTDEGAIFFKDGYTDLRGKFDYASVSTTGLSKVERFSILIISEQNGATVIEAAPPQR